jgi:hypothetical protein
MLVRLFSPISPGDGVEVAMSHYDHSRELPPRLLARVGKLDDGDWLLPNVSWQNDVDFTGRLKCQVRRQRAAGAATSKTDCYRSVTHNSYCLSRGFYKIGDGSLHRELGPNLQSPSPDTPTRLGPKLNSRPAASYRDRLPNGGQQ